MRFRINIKNYKSKKDKKRHRDKAIEKRERNIEKIREKEKENF